MVKISSKLLVTLGIVGLTLGFQACSDDDTTGEPVVENPDNPDNGEDPNNGEDPDNGEDPGNGEDPDNGNPDDPDTDPIPGDNGNLVENGPNTFNQTAWSENYIAGGLSSPAQDFTLNTPNPILSETPAGVYMSNVPLTLEVEDRKQSDWFAHRVLKFTNRSNENLHIDSGFLIVKAPSGSPLSHSFWNSRSPFGHPQQDYVEVKIENTNNSYYIARLVFHDVGEDQRTAYPNQPFEYRLGIPIDPNGGYLSEEETKNSILFIADLNGEKNQELVEKYGLKRFTD